MTRELTDLTSPATSSTLATAHRQSVIGHAVTSLSPVDQLGEDIAVLAARLHAATYELLVMLRRFDQAGGWNNGFRSCAHWLHWRTGIDLGAAREKVRVARALGDLPQLSAALQHGRISYAKVRAITRIATPANEAQLLNIALTATAFQVERVVRAWRRCDRVAAARQADARHLHRGLRTYVDDDGMLVIHGRLAPEQGAVVQRALEAAADGLRQEARQTAAPRAVAEEVTFGQRRADALVRLAEAALAGDLDSGTAGDRYQVVLHVETDLGAKPNERAASSLEAGVIECGDRAVDVSAETSARIACDASVVVLQRDAAGTTIDVGRKTRSVPPAIRRALEARDTGCRFPGCTARRCDAHHVVHWGDGGPTCLDNLVLLCRHHHRLLHEGSYTMHRGTGRAFTFVSPAGRVVDAAPSAPVWSRRRVSTPVWPVSWTDNSPIAEPTAESTDRTAAWLCDLPDDGAGRPVVGPVWDGTRFDLGYVIDVLRGGEALPRRH